MSQTGTLTDCLALTDCQTVWPGPQTVKTGQLDLANTRAALALTPINVLVILEIATKGLNSLCPDLLVLNMLVILC